MCSPQLQATGQNSLKNKYLLKLNCVHFDVANNIIYTAVPKFPEGVYIGTAFKGEVSS